MLHIDPGRFADDLLNWFDRHGRKQLPWKQGRDPYRIWVSEVMLQQTQVQTVIPYFQRFMERFPDVGALSAAEVDEVLALWSGLGYYARGRNLHKAARMIMEHHGGDFPKDIEALNRLPGIGRSTAAAILAQAFNQRHGILDGNVKRVLARMICLDEYPGSAVAQKKLWPLTDGLTPSQRVADYTQAIMDLGALVCVRNKPLCDVCPVKNHCKAREHNCVEQYPYPRPKKLRPLKSKVFIWLEGADRTVLMQRRPPAGIWGGLWCLPEFNDQALAESWLQQHITRKKPAWQAMPVIKHGFTHFDLEIHVLKTIIPARPLPAIAEHALHWHDETKLASLGLPAPFRRLMTTGDTLPE